MSINNLDSSAPILKGPDVSRKLFGGVLDFDAAGHYPGLELLNLIYCTEADSILPVDESVKIKRRSHDFARKLVWDPDFENDDRRHNVLLGDLRAEETLRELFRCLQLEIPSGTKEPKWSRAHFFPYTPSLIHWDARDRGGKSGHRKMSIERLYLRGGGSLAFKALRLDHDTARLDRIRLGFENLYQASKNSPLEVLSNFVNSQSFEDPIGNVDEIEKSSCPKADPFLDVYRDGILNLLEQAQATSVSKVRAVMGWTGLWLALMQNKIAKANLKIEDSIIICDCGAGSPQLRRASQRCLQETLNNILSAIKTIEPRLANATRNKIRSFFWATASANGFLNAWRGRKHFTLTADALEMIVMANVPAGSEMPFDKFVHEILFERLGIAVGRGAAEASGLIQSLDASIFEENEAQLALQMIASGLVTQYSDATRMVSLKSAA